LASRLEGSAAWPASITRSPMDAMSRPAAGASPDWD